VASSVLQICNLALGRLGAQSILDLNGTQKEAQACRLFYQTALDEVLRTHPWNFAVRRQMLTSEAQEPSFGWSNAYVLPADCLRVLDLNDMHEFCDPPRWQIEGRSLLCDQEEAHIRYITRDADPTHYDALFVAALAAKLAALIAKKITGSDNIAGAQLAEYEKLYGPHAKFGDNKEAKAKVKPPWVTSALVKSRRVNNLYSTGWW
jgi:hypothetical protein